MCPACMTTAALIATGATSAGGLLGIVAVKLRARVRHPARQDRSALLDTVRLEIEARNSSARSDLGQTPR
jgi:hypothetical protein